MPTLLLVEGKQDVEFLAQLIKKANLGTCRSHPATEPVDFVLKSADSYERLRASLPEELRSSQFNRFGIIPDADSNPSARWQSLTTRLLEIEERSTRFFQQLPAAPNENGTILHSLTGRTIGIWLWPHNTTGGDLEAFAGQLTPADDALWLHSATTLASLPETRYRNAHRHKARIHTWLAWQDPPGQSIGIAVARGILEVTGSSATNLLDFLTKLKEEPK